MTHPNWSRPGSNKLPRPGPADAQRILATHLRPGEDPDHPVVTFWPYINLGFTGANLINVNLTQCRPDIAWFDGRRSLVKSGSAGQRSPTLSGSTRR